MTSLLRSFAIAGSLALALLAGPSRALEGQDVAGCARSVVALSCSAGGPFLATASGSTVGAERPAGLPAAGDWGDVRHGTVSGLKWGALVGAAAGGIWCALDSSCRESDDGGDGAGAVFESAVWGAVSGATLGALIGAVWGATR